MAPTRPAICRTLTWRVRAFRPAGSMTSRRLRKLDAWFSSAFDSFSNSESIPKLKLLGRAVMALPFFLCGYEVKVQGFSRSTENSLHNFKINPLRSGCIFLFGPAVRDNYLQNVLAGNQFAVQPQTSLRAQALGIDLQPACVRGRLFL